jgi:hypothetical protein
MKKLLVLGALGFVLGSPSASAAGIKLNKVLFPGAIDAIAGSTTPPSEAPLSQAIVFEFSGVPVFKKPIEQGILITVAPENSAGQTVGIRAFGDFEIAGKRVIFTPRLPTGPLPESYSPTADVVNDLSLPGLLPATIYRIDLPIDTPTAIANLKGSKFALPLSFSTKAAVAGPQLVSSLFSNAPQKAPKVKTDKIKPKPGTSGLFPNLFGDPAGLFTAISAKKRPPFRLSFNGPLDPQADNISPTRIRLRAIEDAAGATLDVELASVVVLTSNTPSSAAVTVYPMTSFPLGGTIVLEISDSLRSLSGVSQNDGSVPETFALLAEYEVATGGGEAPIDDQLIEGFDDLTKRDTSIAISEGQQLAGWDANDSGVLRATFGFGGDGSIGRFAPADEVLTIYLDTDYQTFPLFSGSTPDALPGTVVLGGVFNFSDFWLPPNVTLVPRGSNPLVITCTGECLIEGVIDASGSDGSMDVTFDSAIQPVPGGTAGPGGGKGGAGHPVVVSAGGVLQFLQTPQFGESGFAPKTAQNPNPSGGGGGGGQSGCTLPWPFLSSVCADFSVLGDGSRGAGGGSGSFKPFFPNIGATATGGLGPEPSDVLISGRRGGPGIGDHLPVTFDPELPIPGEPLAYAATAGNPTNAVARPNPNPTFAEAYHQGLIYDNPIPSVMNVDASTWAQSKRITLPGEAGPRVFQDADPENDFIGVAGELAEIRGGQGGGGGGSRTEGLTQLCKSVIFDLLDFPFTVLDARGAGGGGGGGAVMIQALGTIEFRGPKAKIHARGGRGGGGEEIGASQRGGAGGAGSGGCIILQTASSVKLNDPSHSTYVLDVSGGSGFDAATLISSSSFGLPGGEPRTLQIGDGAPGGPGLVQIHSPDNASIDFQKIGAEVNLSAYNINGGIGSNDGTDRVDPLVPMTKTPTPLTSKSTARSTWYDLGLVTAEFRPAILTSAGLLDGPLFGVPGEAPYFQGTNAATGLVQTTAEGNVVSPFDADIEVDAPDLFLADFIPNGPAVFQAVKVEFQGAPDDVSNPGLPDLGNATPWATDARELNGMRHVRWQITFDIATNPLAPPTPSTPRPVVNVLRIPFRF